MKFMRAKHFAPVFFFSVLIPPFIYIPFYPLVIKRSWIPNNLFFILVVSIG